MNNVQTERTTDGFLVLTIDCPDTALNVVSMRLIEEIEGIMNRLEQDKTVAGVVVMSGKPDHFVVGADLDEIRQKETKAEISDYINKGNNLLNRMEDYEKPVICAVHGNCLGGGLEIALACDYRIGSDHPSTLLGLPEVQVGLFPAAGGTHRLVRLIGLVDALPLLLTGNPIRAKKAEKLGILDELVDPYSLKEAALYMVRALSKGDSTGEKAKKPFVRNLLNSPFGRPAVLKRARKAVMEQTGGNYPAPLALLDSIARGYKLGVRKGIEEDCIKFAELATGRESKGLIHLFFSTTELKKNPCEIKGKKVKKLAVLGSGFMGSGIAGISTAVCDTILMKDITLDKAAAGIHDVWEGLKKQARSGAITAFEQDVRYGKLIACHDYSLFARTDLVIEAVFEDLDLKRKMLNEIESIGDDGIIFASNTSSIPIKDISKGCKRPDLVIGMHYFSPVHSMPLLEVIATDQTADWVKGKVIDFGIRQGKTCILVKDGPAFYTTRILAMMLNEVNLAIEEGIDIHFIDHSLKAFGFPVGPVALIDEVGIDVGYHVGNVLKEAFSSREFKSADIIEKLYHQGFLGKKNKKGFYDYQQKRVKQKRPVNQEVYDILSIDHTVSIDETTLQNRIGLTMVNEAILCLEEGIIDCPRDGDIGAVFGLGFPPFTGGPFQYVDQVGADAIKSRLEDLAQMYGGRFQPADYLCQNAANNKTFYR